MRRFIYYYLYESREDNLIKYIKDMFHGEIGYVLYKTKHYKYIILFHEDRISRGISQNALFAFIYNTNSPYRQMLSYNQK